jgi:phosphoenolpyruvate carboxykinase (ATP)
VSDTPEKHSDQTITRAEYEKVAAIQDAYIRDQEMVVVNGFIGNDPEFRVPARLIIEKANANIAGMQQQLYYTDDDVVLSEDYEPTLQIIYTPNLEIPGYPSDRIIAVDLDNGITRVINSDYFGESKKAGLRMWNKIVYDKGGLSLHSGCKIIPVGDEKKTVLITGLSGTGKTTTTFTSQNNSQPVQDDFCALMPGGKVYASESGCFAKTFSLDPEFEPTIFKAVSDPVAYLENVSQNDDGKVDFFDTSYTKNGRATFPMSKVKDAANPLEMDKASILLILNRNENIIPSVVKLKGAQAAAFFMLGETQGTSAGGKEEAGKSLRIPGTNPFFPLLHSQQGNRMKELLETCDMEVYLMNTGRVGGAENDERSKKVKIPHSSAAVKGIAEGTIEWTTDPDFGYEIAASVPGFDDEELLQPKKLYERQGRMDEYNTMVQKLKTERVEYLESFPGLDAGVIATMR